MRSWATCTKFLSSCMCFWNRRFSSSSSRSKSLAASSKAWMRPFQERRAGTWGATAELTPVPITRTSSGARLVFRLGSSFLWGRQRLSDDGSQDGTSQILPTAWRLNKLFSSPLTCSRTLNHTFYVGPAKIRNSKKKKRKDFNQPCWWISYSHSVQLALKQHLSLPGLFSIGVCILRIHCRPLLSFHCYNRSHSAPVMKTWSIKSLCAVCLGSD